MEIPDLNSTRKQAENQISQTTTAEELENWRVYYLGRNGLIARLFKVVPTLNQNERVTFGQNLNSLKKEILTLTENQKEKVIKQKITKDQELSLYSLPKFGHFHPLSITENEINILFKSLGFSIYEGPEIETDEFNFRRLNVPIDHPARDMQDTIYIQEPEILMSTQTSSIEAHLLQNEKPPFKIAFPGHAFRNETVTKSNHFIFHQYQGVAVDKNITLKDLIGVFNLLFKHLYGSQVIVRYRCKYYPEVEPGMGLDLQCFNCHGTGCSVCKGAGWIEMGGSGIIHPKVLQMAGIDPTKWRGFAFGLGLDRWTMAKYQINDIRTLTGGNLAYKPYEP